MTKLKVFWSNPENILQAHTHELWMTLSYYHNFGTLFVQFNVSYLFALNITP